MSQCMCDAQRDVQLGTGAGRAELLTLHFLWAGSYPRALSYCCLR